MISTFLKIDGANMPEPAVFRVSGNDLDGENTRRLENGNMNRSVIGYGWRTPVSEWKGIPQAEAQTLLSAIMKVSFTVSYIDPAVGAVTKTCYAGPWEAEYIPKTAGHPGGPLWNISIDLIESNR
ncbi:MAG: hypothetical protein PHP22_09755 [Oscillospiraceae bacterium]|nr:hypothetical protein [Oscillospiraceae bacterium]